MNRDNAALLDIANACKLILEFKTETKELLFSDVKSASAILHQLMVIGEATKRLSDEIREQNSAIEWKLIAGMRDVLIHSYDDVDLHAVWNTIDKDIPKLLNVVSELLSELDSEKQ